VFSQYDSYTWHIYYKETIFIIKKIKLIYILFIYMKDNLFYFYIGLIFLGIFSIIYQVYEYGIRGYFERRLERRRQRVDRLTNNYLN
jgi:hypothetical protein